MDLVAVHGCGAWIQCTGMVITREAGDSVPRGVHSYRYLHALQLVSVDPSLSESPSEALHSFFARPPLPVCV